MIVQDLRRAEGATTAELGRVADAIALKVLQWRTALPDGFQIADAVAVTCVGARAAVASAMSALPRFQGAPAGKGGSGVAGVRTLVQHGVLSVSGGRVALSDAGAIARRPSGVRR